MRKTHLRCVVDAELGVLQTLCGLAATPKRPMTDNEAEVNCDRCKAELEAIHREIARQEKRVR